MEILESIQTYIKLVWRLVPLFGVDAGGCECRQSGCPKPAKHPRFCDWGARASSDPAELWKLQRKARAPLPPCPQADPERLHKGKGVGEFVMEDASGPCVADDITRAPGVAEGERNRTLRGLIGVDMARNGGVRPGLLDDALDWAARCDPPYPADEARGGVEYFTRRDRNGELQHQPQRNGSATPAATLAGASRAGRRSYTSRRNPPVIVYAGGRTWGSRAYRRFDTVAIASNEPQRVASVCRGDGRMGSGSRLSVGHRRYVVGLLATASAHFWATWVKQEDLRHLHPAGSLIPRVEFFWRTV